MKKRLIALLCVAAMLLSVMAVTVSATTWLPDTADEGSDKIGITHKTGTDLENWKATNFESKTSKTDQEYSFVFVGDTQFLTYADARDNTKNVQAIYKWIADNKSNKKIAHVFALGDMTHFSYGNDETLINDRAYNLGFGTGTAEWNVVKAATDQLKDAGISYSVVRGNHDDYTIDTIYGGDSTYTSQFNDFYRPNSGRYMSNSITNSWRTLDIHGDKYLFLTIDFNPTMAVLDWANEVIANNPDRKVIITTHSYLSPDGTHQKAESDYDSYKGGLEAITESTVDGEMMWDKLVRKYENIIMVVGGHVSTGDKGEDTSEHNVTYTYRTGDNGNKVTEMIINPQVLDQLQTYTGLVCVMNFYDNGERVELEYYSPLLTDKLRFKEIED